MLPPAWAARALDCDVNRSREGYLAMTGNSSETNQLLEQAAQGTRRVWGRCWRGTAIGSAAWLRCGWIVGCKGGSTPRT